MCAVERERNGYSCMGFYLRSADSSESDLVANLFVCGMVMRCNHEIESRVILWILISTRRLFDMALGCHTMRYKRETRGNKCQVSRQTRTVQRH